MRGIDAGGTELSYGRAGSGEPMLLIQGMSATHLAWGRPFLDQLERDFETIVFDNRGMGDSGRAELPFTIADMAADTAALLDALEIESAHVVGISMGGMIAQELALAHPRASPQPDPRRDLLRRPRGQADGPRGPPDAGRRATPRATANGCCGRCGRSTSPPPSARTTRASPPSARWGRTLPAPQPVVLQQMQACAAHDTSARLGGMEPPTLVIHGTADRLIPVDNGEADRLADPGRPARAARGCRPHVLVGAAPALGGADPRARAGPGLIRPFSGLRSRTGSSLPLTLKT